MKPNPMALCLYEKEEDQFGLAGGSLISQRM